MRNLKNNWTTEKPHKVQSTVEFRCWNITTQARLHYLLDQQSGWDTDKVSSWRGHVLTCNSLWLDQDTQSEWQIHTSGYKTTSGNKLRIKSCFKLSMTEEGVLSSTVLQLCWGGFILPKDSPNWLGWIQSRPYSGDIQPCKGLQSIENISSRSPDISVYNCEVCNQEGGLELFCEWCWWCPQCCQC